LKKITVRKNDENQRLDKFLSKSFSALPSSLMYKAIRKKDIKRNGKRCAPDDKLSEGDVLTIYLPDDVLEFQPVKYDFLNASKSLDIIYEDPHLLILNKPTGLLVHPDKNEYGDTLLFRIQRYLYEKGEYHPEAENQFAPALINRIDRNTQGLVMAAKDAESLRILNEKLKKHEIQKYYYALVFGHMAKKEDHLIGYLEKNESQNRVYISSERTSNQSRTILTDYRVLEEKNGISLLEIHLLTGRTHQIRAHLATIGHPIVGDGKYGTNRQNRPTGMTHQALCSYRLVFRFNESAGELDYLNGREFQLSDVDFVQWFRSNQIKTN